MNEGWLWLSILKTTASPSPMSMTPAFSPGPQMTRGPLVGSVRSQIFDDLYEQCSLHIAAMMPVSVRFGVRPRSPASSAVTLLPITANAGFVAVAPAPSVLRDAPRWGAPQDEEHLFVALETYLILRS